MVSAMYGSSKLQIFELPANSEKIVMCCGLSQHNLRGIYSRSSTKSFLVLFLEKEHIFSCNFFSKSKLNAQWIGVRFSPEKSQKALVICLNIWYNKQNRVEFCAWL